MKNAHVEFALLSVLAGSLLAPMDTLASQKSSPGNRSSQRGAAQPAVAPQQGTVAPTKPAITPSLEEMPAQPPQVTFSAGELTIVARNSSLGAILQEVQTKTGANIDMPEPPADRVVGEFGPGPAREVLSALLNGSHFNYVLLGSPQDPGSLEKVVLLSKASVPDQPSANQAVVAPVLPRRGNVVQQGDDANADSTEDMSETEQTPEVQPPADPNGAQNETPAVKTPQQLLQELQRQQLQQQQAPNGQQPPQQK